MLMEIDPLCREIVTADVLKNKHNYSQSIFMFIIRGVIICIKDLNI